MMCEDGGRWRRARCIIMSVSMHGTLANIRLCRKAIEIGEQLLHRHAFDRYGCEHDNHSLPESTKHHSPTCHSIINDRPFS